MIVPHILMALSEAELMAIMPRALIIGTALGAVYDFLRAVRRTFPHKLVYIAMQDILYFILYGSIIFYNLMHYGKGMLILSVIASFIVGTLIYLLIFSRYILNLLVFALGVLLKIIRIITFPVVKILDFFSKKVLQPIIKLLYNVCASINRKVLKGVTGLKNAVKIQPNKRQSDKPKHEARKSISPK